MTRTQVGTHVLFLVAFLLVVPSVGAQQVTGRVLDQQTGQPLAAVQVFIPETGLGALTQQNGRYLLLNVPAGTYTLTAQRIGYREQTAEITVAAGATVVRDFAMSEEALNLDEIVVTGTAGGGRQREVGASVSRIGAEQLRMAPVGDLQRALQGQVGGLVMQQGSPQPGSAPIFSLRGVNSISQGSEPLIYVDGVRIYGKASESATLVGRGAGDSYNPLSNLRPQDIERVEVVRGPAATTLYGTEASGGVIQIFTRRGLTGDAQWSAGITAGAARIGHVGANDATNPDGFGFNNCRDRVTSAGVPFSDLTCGDDGDFLKLGPLQRYNLAVQGGSENFTYALSGNFRDESAPIDGSKAGVDRPGGIRDGGVRANFTFQMSPTLSAQWSSSLNLGSVRWVPATLSVSRSWVTNMMRGPAGIIKQDGQPASALGLLLELRDKKQQVTTGLILDHRLSDRFSHRLSIGLDLNQNLSSRFEPFGYWNLPTGGYRENTWTHSTTSIDYGASFRTAFRGGGAVSSTTSAGVQMYQDVDRNVTKEVAEFSAPTEVPTFTFGSRRTIDRDDKLRVINAGFYVQQMFGYKEYLFVTAGLRMDGNSAFGRDFGLQPYPKLSLSYILSDMDFWPTDWFESFKLRAAMGEAGKAPGAFDAVRSWTPVAGDQGKPGFIPSTVGNPDLGPERTREYEIGFDASLYDGRITAEVTAFHQRTTDALVPITPIPTLGFGTPQLTNIGVLQNQGGEISLDFGLIRRPNFGLDLGVMLSRAETKVIDTGGLDILVGSRQRARIWAREGYPFPALFGHKVMNANEFADPIIEGDQFFGPIFPVNMMIVRSSVRLGTSLTVSAMGEYQGGHWVWYNGGFRLMERDLFPGCFETQRVLRAAEQGNTEPLSRVTALLRAKCNVDRATQDQRLFMESSDFFKLRNVTVSYQLPEFLLRSIAQSATLTFSANGNLWVKTDYWGMDPENRNRRGALTQAVDWDGLPPYQTYVVSLRVRF